MSQIPLLVSWFSGLRSYVKEVSRVSGHIFKVPGPTYKLGPRSRVSGPTLRVPGLTHNMVISKVKYEFFCLEFLLLFQNKKFITSLLKKWKKKKH